MFENRPVGISNLAEHPHDAAVFGAPGKEHQRRRVGDKEEIRVDVPVKAFDGGSVDRDAVLEGVLELGGHQRDILLTAEDVGVGEADEFDVIFFDKLTNLFS